MRAVRVQTGGEDSPLPLLCSKYHRTGAIAKEDAGSPVLPIQYAAECLRTDHQRISRASGANHAVCYGKRIEKAGADRCYIKGHAAIAAQSILNNRRGCRKCLVGRRGCDNDQIDIGAAETRCLHGFLRRLDGKARRRFVILCDMAEPDSCALDDPFVCRVDPLGQISVGHTGSRQCRAGSLDYGPLDSCAAHFATSATGAASLIFFKSSLIRSKILSSTSRAATSTALATPLASALP